MFAAKNADVIWIILSSSFNNSMTQCLAQELPHRAKPNLLCQPQSHKHFSITKCDWESIVQLQWKSFMISWRMMYHYSTYLACHVDVLTVGFRLSSAWQRIKRPRPYPLWLLQLITEPHNCCSSIGLDFGTWQMHNWMNLRHLGYRLPIEIEEDWFGIYSTGIAKSPSAWALPICCLLSLQGVLQENGTPSTRKNKCGGGGTMSMPFMPFHTVVSWIWLGKSWKLWREHCWVTQVKPHSSQRWPPNYLPHLFFSQILNVALATIGYDWMLENPNLRLPCWIRG